MVSSPKYSLTTSVNGVNVYSAKGDLVGQTPLILKKEDISKALEGDFVTLILEKEGYLSRVVFFEASKSVELKIDLKRDKFFQDNKYMLLQSRNKVLSDENDFLKRENDHYKENHKETPKKVKIITIKDEPIKKKSVVSVPKRKTIEKVKKRFKRKGKLISHQKKYNSKLMNKYLYIQKLINYRDFKTAKNELFEVDKKYPNMPTTYNLLAYIEIEKGNYRSARNLLDRSVFFNKNDSVTNRLMEALVAIEKKSIN